MAGKTGGRIAVWSFWIGMAFLLLYLVGGRRGPLHPLWRAATFLFPDNASGTITSTGEGGNWTMKVNACQAGERRQYWGVAFFDDSQPATGGHIALPESGAEHLDLNLVGRPGSLRYSRQDCSAWDADLQHTHSTYNGVWAIQGHARFDCHFTDPESHVVGDLQFRSCH